MERVSQIPFLDDVPRGDFVHLTYKILSPCIMQGGFVQFYAGQNKQLKVSGWIEGKNGAMDFWDWPFHVASDDRYQRGDDERISIDRVLPLEVGDIIHVYAANTSDNEDVISYKLNLQVVLSYYEARRGFGGVAYA